MSPTVEENIWVAQMGLDRFLKSVPCWPGSDLGESLKKKVNIIKTHYV